MAEPAGRGLSNRQRRTRKDLLEAAARLLARGGSPSMEAVATEALVSRATAYRYFSSVEAVIVEAALDRLAPNPEALFAGDASTDPVARIDRAEAAMHELSFGHEHELKLMLVNALQMALKDGPAAVPVRQNRRLPLIEAALAPARDRLGEPAYQRLCAALAVIFGTESMIVFRDVLGLDGGQARAVKSWAVRTLVQATLAEAAP